MKHLRRGLIGLALLGAGFGLGSYGSPTWGQRPGPSACPNEPPPRCWEAVVYLPVADGGGKPLADSEFQAAVGILVNHFGGATIGEQRQGYWLDRAGQVRREPVRPVAVTFRRDRLDEFRRDVRAVGRALKQECMYVRLEAPRVELIDSGQGSSKGP